MVLNILRTMLFVVFFSVSVFAEQNSNSATVPIRRVLGHSDTLELQYTLNNSEVLSLAHQTIGLELQLQCDTVDGKDISPYRYIVHLQKGTHALYWHAQQFECTLEYMHIRPVYLNNQNNTSVFSASMYSTVPLHIFTIHSLSLKVKICTMTSTIKTASLYDMMHWQFSHDNDYTVFRWQQYPYVLVFFFKDKQVQARYLKRLAFFVEKRLTRGSIMYDEQIAHRKGWGAHNYTMEDIRIFFEQGRTKNFPRLDATTTIFPFHTEELDLKYLLIEQGFLRVSAQDKALLQKVKDEGTINYSMIANMPILSAQHYMVSIALTYSDELIKSLLSHELLHTFYFHDEQLRNYVATLWYQLGTAKQSLWKRFFAYNGYDETHTYLVQNEFFAYLLQRPISSLAWYLFARIIPESAVVLSKNEADNFTTAMTKIAQNLERYVYKKYGVKAGNLMYVKGE